MLNAGQFILKMLLWEMRSWFLRFFCLIKVAIKTGLTVHCLSFILVEYVYCTVALIFLFHLYCRTLFILSFLKKKMFKSEEVIRIQQWEEDDNTENANSQKRGTNNETCILEVTLV